jgi:hypothetical protein
MYKKLLIILVVLFNQPVFAQNFSKPRFLKYPTAACPVDIRNQLSYEGFLKADSLNVRVFDTILIQKASSEIKDKANNVIVSKGDSLKTTVRDTALLSAIVFNEDLAFDVIQQIGSYSLIKFWPINGKNLVSVFETGINLKMNDLVTNGLKGFLKKTNNKNDTIDKKDTIKYDLSKNAYIVPTNLIINNSVEFESKFHQWNIGILILPIKVRPFATESGHFDFLDGLSLGTAFSFNIDHNWVKDRSINIVLYAGLSSFTSDSVKIKERREDYKITAFSPAVGLMFEKSGVQICGMLGMDFPVGSIQKNWVYRNMPWVSIGLGFSLFKISNNDSNKTGTNSE